MPGGREGPGKPYDAGAGGDCIYAGGGVLSGAGYVSDDDGDVLVLEPSDDASEGAGVGGAEDAYVTVMDDYDSDASDAEDSAGEVVGALAE